MGLAVFLENQIHERTYAGADAGRWISSLLPLARRDGQLSGVSVYGDTMFNITQLRRIVEETGEILESHPELAHEISELDKLIQMVIRGRGYLWISGD